MTDLIKALEPEFDRRRIDDLHWGVYRINDKGEIYPTPFVQCLTLGDALITYATVYSKKGGSYAVAPLMTNEFLNHRLTQQQQMDCPELPEQSHPKSDH